MNVIKFSHDYFKFPDGWQEEKFCLLHVFVEERKNLSEKFVKYDTYFLDEHGEIDYYKLPKGKVLILLFNVVDEFFLLTTIRRHTAEKEIYYKSKVGEYFGFEKVMLNE